MASLERGLALVESPCDTNGRRIPKWRRFRFSAFRNGVSYSSGKMLELRERRQTFACVPGRMRRKIQVKKEEERGMRKERRKRMKLFKLYIKAAILKVFIIVSRIIVWIIVS